MEFETKPRPKAKSKDDESILRPNLLGFVQHGVGQHGVGQHGPQHGIHTRGLADQFSFEGATPIHRAPAISIPHLKPERLQRQKIARDMADFTCSPLSAQRQVLSPIFEGAALGRSLLGHEAPALQRQRLEQQVAQQQQRVGEDNLDQGEHQAARMRVAQRQARIPQLTGPPSSPAQWAQAGQYEVQRVASPTHPGHPRSMQDAEYAQHLGTLQTVGTRLGQGFRTDRGTAVQRYASYSEALAPFERMGTATGKAVVTTAMMQVPVSEKSALKTAIAGVVQRQQAQEAADDNVLNYHALQRQLDAFDEQVKQPVLEQIQARRGAGKPLPAELHKALALELNADLSRVRIHDDAEADLLAKKVNAVAFTTGQDIFFRAGRYDLASQAGLNLVAHEVLHAYQQGLGRVQPGIDPDAGLEQEAQAFGAAFAQKAGQQQVGQQQAGLNFTTGLEDKAVPQQKAAQRHLPFNPAWTPPQFQPSSHAPGVYTPKAGLERAQEGAVQQISLNPFASLYGLQRQSEGTIQRLDLNPLHALQHGAEWAANKGKEMIASGLSILPGYRPLCLAFGKDLVTGKAMDQNPNAILDALAGWVPGPMKAMIARLRETNAIPKAWAWFQGELGKLNLGGALTEVMSAVKSLDLGKAQSAISGRVSGLMRLVTASVRKLAEIALDAVAAGLGPAAQQVIAGLKKSGDTIVKVLKDPGTFAKNMVSAVGGGFKQFSSNAPRHLAQGAGLWLTGQSGITFPDKLDVQGVFMTVLSVLGLTYQNFRGKLVQQLGKGGAEKLAQAEKSVDVVRRLSSKGLHAAEELQGSKAEVGNQAKTEVITEVRNNVVQAAVMKLVSLFIPGGGFVTALISAFDTVKFLIDKGRSIGSLVMSVVGSVGAIAAGNTSAAISGVERSLAASIPLALGFLGQVLHLGKIGGRVKGIIGKLRGKLERVQEKVMKRVAALIDKVLGKGKTGEKTATPTAAADKTKDHDLKVKKGLADIPRIEQSFAKNGMLQNQEAAKKVARAVKGRHTIFKSVTPRFSKQKVTYDWVASSGTAGGTAPLAVLNIDVEGIRKEFWKKAGRPGWSSATKKAMAKQYPGQHVTVAGITLTTLKSGNDRRHIMAFDQTVTTVASHLNNLPYDEAKTLLAAKGFAPKAATEPAIKAALKSLLSKEFNQVQNLFVDGAAENQQKGREMELAEQRRKKALAEQEKELNAGNQAAAKQAKTKADQETQLIGAHATDVPKGQASGQKLGMPQQLSITTLKAFRASRYAALEGQMQAVKAGQGTPVLSNLWTQAQAEMEVARTQVSRLAEFSKTGNPAANSKITNAIEHATVQLRVLSDIVGGS